MNGTFSPKERLLRILNKQGAERPPVICPGGMMNAAIADVMRKTGHTLPEAHHSAGLMENLACDISEQTGFENFGLPFCMTIEAEALGSDINFGSLTCEPKIARESFASVDAVTFLPRGSILRNSRAAAVIEAVSVLSKKHPDIPVIGSITGPISLAASLVDPMTFLKELRKKSEMSHKVIDYVTDQIIDYAGLIAENGATVISIADPTATGEILGPELFAEFAVPAINRIVQAIHNMSVPVIVHICGDVKMVKKQLAGLRGKAISVDAMVNLQTLKAEYPFLTTMGNLSTYMLEFAGTEKICNATRYLLEKKIDIISPACGISTSTPLSNITAFTRAVKEGM
ncbi:MAG: methylcobamide--CoM methyltransferase [Spirochaetaceae bacterium]|jgi:[methyl-Co(III) methanol-specific corrinoid protein]:coenzyme M methyltransferase|nr:methylcobamide--CoM methyltransferase [Spirochaetaceae bacterium]